MKWKDNADTQEKEERGRSYPGPSISKLYTVFRMKMFVEKRAGLTSQFLVNHQILNEKNSNFILNLGYDYH